MFSSTLSVLMPFSFTHGLCAVTWLWAVLELWGREWDFNERSGVSVYITVLMKSSHEIRALVMIVPGFLFWFWVGLFVFWCPVVCGVWGFVFLEGGVFLRVCFACLPKKKKKERGKNIASQRLYKPSGNTVSSHTEIIKIWILRPQRGAKWELQPLPLDP